MREDYGSKVTRFLLRYELPTVHHKVRQAAMGVFVELKNDLFGEEDVCDIVDLEGPSLAFFTGGAWIV